MSLMQGRRWMRKICIFTETVYQEIIVLIFPRLLWDRFRNFPNLRDATDTFNFLRHVMRAIWSVRPKCSHRFVSLKETPLKPVRIFKHTTFYSAEQTAMRTKWFKHIAIETVQEHLLQSEGWKVWETLRDSGPEGPDGPSLVKARGFAMLLHQRSYQRAQILPPGTRCPRLSCTV